MPSLSNIPEPTTAYRPEAPTPAPQVALETLKVQPDETQVATKDKQTTEDDEPQQMIDSVSCLLILLVAGGLLRLVLGLFGPLQGIDPARLERMADQGRRAFSDHPASAYPLADLLAAGVWYAGLPSWVMVAFGSLLTLAATPAAYVIGRAATGRRAAGILAAALITVHPAVLTASNTLSGSAIALGLVTIGLAMSAHAAKRGFAFAFGGGITLALAGLAAPLCWVIAALAGPFAGHTAFERGPRRAIAYALTVFVLGLGPIMAYRLAMFGPTTNAALIEFSNNAANATDRDHLDRMLITLTDPSLAELGKALHLPVGEAGKLTANTITAEMSDHRSPPDAVADLLADAWLLMNAALASLATVSIGVMLARRRYVETAVIAAPLLTFAFANLTPGEVLRLPMIALVGVLAAGLLANRPIVNVDEEALAARATRKAAKLAAKEEKERARQERDLDKHKGDIYAFDKPTRRERKERKKLQNKPKDATPPAGILTARVTEDSSIPARPI